MPLQRGAELGKLARREAARASARRTSATSPRQRRHLRAARVGEELPRPCAARAPGPRRARRGERTPCSSRAASGARRAHLLVRVRERVHLLERIAALDALRRPPAAARAAPAPAAARAPRGTSCRRVRPTGCPTRKRRVVPTIDRLRSDSPDGTRRTRASCAARLRRRAATRACARRARRRPTRSGAARRCAGDPDRTPRRRGRARAGSRPPPSPAGAGRASGSQRVDAKTSRPRGAPRVQRSGRRCTWPSSQSDGMKRDGGGQPAVSAAEWRADRPSWPTRARRRASRRARRGRAVRSERCSTSSSASPPRTASRYAWASSGVTSSGGASTAWIVAPLRGGRHRAARRAD